MLNEITGTRYNSASSGDRLNSRCRHSMQPKTMLGHKQGLPHDDFQSRMLAVGSDLTDTAIKALLDRISSTSKPYPGLNMPLTTRYLRSRSEQSG